MNAIYDLIGRKAYEQKMLHPIPETSVVKREEYLLKKALNKIVLDIGASGPMHNAIKQVAKRCYGIDIKPSQEADYYQYDLESADELPDFHDLDLIIAGEIIEHLDNAGHFLDLLKKYPCKVIITAPNAFNAQNGRTIRQGIETINPEHVSWYSYWTLSNLVKKHGYKLIEWFWYNGKPFTAEGMIFLVECEKWQH